MPHAIIATERERRPSPLFVIFFIGVDRLIRVNFDLGAGPETFLRQALDGVRAKLAECRSGQLPGFGKPTGVVVNYSPDHAIHYDLKGNVVEVLNVLDQRATG